MLTKRECSKCDNFVEVATSQKHIHLIINALLFATVATKLHKQDGWKRKDWERKVTNRKVGNGSLGKEREQLGSAWRGRTEPGTSLVATNLVLYKKHTLPIFPDLTGYARPKLT